MDDYRNDLLGQHDIATTMPVLGKLRPGIKVLKSGCTATDQAIYDTMVAEGAMWYEIEQKLGNDSSGKSKLKPNNQDYFTVRPADCKINQANAEKIHKLYDNDKGHIKSVPIVFMFNDWFQNIPHKLVSWGSNSVKFASSYVEKDSKQVRVCTSPMPRKPGERPTPGMRPAHVHGPCVPETCKVYQKGYCKLHGYIQCIIPGTVGAGLWRIETTSIYSLQQIRQTMALVSSITRGRLAGLYKDGAPVFTVRKVADTISRVNIEDGKSVKTDQDLIYLDANIEMAELALAYEETAMLSRGARAANVLTSGSPGATKQKEESPAHVEVETTAETKLEETASDFTPITEETEDEKARKGIIERITRAWGDGSLTIQVKLDLKKQHPKAVEEMALDELSAFETSILGVLVHKNDIGAAPKDGKLV